MSARLAFGALLLACAATGTAGAQLSSSRQPETLMSEGHTLYDAGRFKEAAASFERAMQLGVARPHEAAQEVARAYTRLGNRKQATRWVEIAELLASDQHDARQDAARPLPACLQALYRDALISRLEETPWRTRPAGTPTAKSRSSGSSTISTT